MDKFCKLFETEKYGQILVKLDRAYNNDGAELRIYVQPEGLGVCSIATLYGDTERDWARAESALANLDQAKAERVAASIFKVTAQLPIRRG